MEELEFLRNLVIQQNKIIEILIGNNVNNPIEYIISDIKHFEQKKEVFQKFIAQQLVSVKDEKIKPLLNSIYDIMLPKIKQLHEDSKKSNYKHRDREKEDVRFLNHQSLKLEEEQNKIYKLIIKLKKP